jgi:hypothetical protein
MARSQKEHRLNADGAASDVPASGYAAMAFGVIISLAVGLASWRFSFTVADKDMTSRLC